MNVKQIYELMNSVTGEILGKTDLVAEDLQNVVDVGTQIFDATAVDNFVKTLVNHIGRVIFVTRPYSGSMASVLMDGWEFGSICEKIQADMPVASENESWDLTDKQSYDPNIFYKPSVSAKFFNKRVTFEVDQSFTERQVKESFSGVQQLNAFLSMLYIAVENSMTVKTTSLIRRTVNNMMAETIHSEYPTPAETGKGYADSTGIRAVNLLKMYNSHFTKTLTPAACITDADFLKFAAMQMGLTIDRMKEMSTLFNVGGKERFTTKENLSAILLSNFASAASVYLQSDTFHEQYTALPNADTVSYWQGSGKDYSFTNVSTIHVTDSSGNEVNISGILGVVFDRNALGVTNLSRRVTTNYNAKAEFFTNFYKFDAGYFNDLNENMVVFFVA